METMTPTMRSTCSSVSSVINTLQAFTRLVRTGQCVRSPRHLSCMTSLDGITSTTRVASCSTTLLSRRREEVAVIRELGVWEVVGTRRGEVVFGTRWVGINKGDAVGWSYRSTNVKPTGLFLQPLHQTTGGTAKFVDLCNGRRALQRC